MKKYMGGKNNKKNKNKNKTKPLVSICTPTFNRRPFIPIMFECFRNQTYPKSRIEWIIVDDGTDRIEDLIKDANIPQIQYFRIDQKMTLGAKRNYMHTKANGSIIVYMDDDDYYPPERIEHAVETLQQNPKALCAGSSEIYVYFKHIQTMYKGGPYGPNHATAGTFAFRRELLDQTKYDEKACLAEEKEFLKNYTIPFAQLDPLKTILVFSHVQNTFDKKKLLETPNPKFVACERKIEEFIKFNSEKNIKDYFLTDIDKLLEDYRPGDPSMKPDVIAQTKEIEKQREEMRKQMAATQGQIVIQAPGQPPRTVNNQEVVKLMENLQKELENRSNKIKQLEEALKNASSQSSQIVLQQPGKDNKTLTQPEIIHLLEVQKKAIIQKDEKIQEMTETIKTLETQISTMESSRLPEPVIVQ
jgi:hypothetical protein